MAKIKIKKKNYQEKIEEVQQNIISTSLWRERESSCEKSAEWNEKNTQKILP